MKFTCALRTQFSARVFLAVLSWTFFSGSVVAPKMRKALFGTIKYIRIPATKTGNFRFVLIPKPLVSSGLIGLLLFRMTEITTQWIACDVPSSNWV